MALKTKTLSHDQELPQPFLEQFGFQPQEPLKAIYGSMGVLLLRASASLADILLALEEIKATYRNEIRDLDQEWDDFTLAEEWLAPEI
jgi:hypothetical protein